MEKAIMSFRNGDAGLNAISRTYGLPKATLKRRLEVKNKYANGPKKCIGRPCTLPAQLEDMLVEYLL